MSENTYLLDGGGLACSKLYLNASAPNSPTSRVQKCSALQIYKTFRRNLQCAANFIRFYIFFAAHCIFTLHIYWVKPLNSLNKGTGNIGCGNQADA